jgi:hypothetical protein
MFENPSPTEILKRRANVRVALESRGVGMAVTSLASEMKSRDKRDLVGNIAKLKERGRTQKYGTETTRNLFIPFNVHDYKGMAKLVPDVTRDRIST